MNARKFFVVVVLFAACGEEVEFEPDEDTATDADTDSDSDTDSDTDSDSDADADADADSDADTDTGMDPMPSMQSCDGGYADTIAHLCWQDPSYNDNESDWASAVEACENLDWGDHTDWRLPSIQELVSLIRGCVDTVSYDQLFASTCGVSYPDTCDISYGYAVGCESCDPQGGPGADGWYQDPVLSGPGLLNWFLWSSSPTSVSLDATEAWIVTFGDGDVTQYQKDYTAGFRCVRDQE